MIKRQRLIILFCLALTGTLGVPLRTSYARSQPSNHWGYCADVYPGHDMLFLAKGAYAQQFCHFFTTNTVAGFGRLKAINRYRYRWNANDDTFSYQAYGVAAVTAQPSVYHVCTYNYRYLGHTGIFGVYDSGGAFYGHQLCDNLAGGTLETGSATYDDWS